jgi:hypothetical protein
MAMKRIMFAFVCALSISLAVQGECKVQPPPAQSAAGGSQSGATAQTPAQTPPQTPAPANDGKTRLYVTDSESWEASGGWGKGDGKSGGSSKNGPSPQAADFMKNFNERCPRVTVTDDKDRAKYAVIIYHAGAKGVLVHQNKIAVLNRQGDVIFSDATHKVGNSVKDACFAIEKADEGKQ